MDTAYTYVYLLLGDTHIHSNYLIYEINNFHEQQTHDINISQLYKNKDKLNVPIKSYVTDHVPIKSYLTHHVPRKSYVTDENGIINCMYQ